MVIRSGAVRYSAVGKEHIAPADFGGSWYNYSKILFPYRCRSHALSLILEAMLEAILEAIIEAIDKGSDRWFRDEVIR